MSEDADERGARRRKDTLALILRAADAGEVISVPDIKRRLPWGDQITKHGLLWILDTLEEQGFIERRWGKDLGPMEHGKTSYVIPKKRAYDLRAGR